MYNKIVKELQSISDNDFAEWFRPFLRIDKNSKEILLGIRVPKLRKIAKLYKDILPDDLTELLHSNYHEARLLAIFIMLIKTKKEPQKMCQLYLDNLKYINNWDLIDYSAPHIVAPNTGIDTLKKLSESDYLWANRVAIVSTIYYIKQGNYDLTVDFAKKYINHPHHLIHKATGWMLREIGKRNRTVLIDFLDKYSTQMPSVMKSYAKECLKNSVKMKNYP